MSDSAQAVCLDGVCCTWPTIMALPNRSEIQPGQRVSVVEKQNQSTGQQTEGVVTRILTKSSFHPHGIKVMLEDGRVGRVQAIVEQS